MRPLHGGFAEIAPTMLRRSTYLTAQRRPPMSKHDLDRFDLDAIDLRARKLRAEYIAGFFKRKAR